MRWYLSLFVLITLTPSLVAQTWLRHAVDDSSRGADGVKLADVNGDGLPDITTGWEEGGITRVYLHPSEDAVTEPWPAVTVGKTPSVEDAVFVDLDDDGAFDVVSCCEGRTRTMFVHWAPPEPERYLDSSAWVTEPIPASKELMMWMYAIPVDLDGQHGIDLIAAGKGDGAAIGWWQAPANPRSLADWAFHPISPAGWVMSLEPRDMDGDGDLDVVTTDRKGKTRGCRWLENPGLGVAQTQLWQNHAIAGTDQEVMFMSLNAEGTHAAFGVQPKEVLICQRLDLKELSWETETVSYPEETGGAKAVAVGDIDGDGGWDLVLSCEGATPPKSGVVWLRRTAHGWERHEISGPDGIKYDRIELVDLDGDGDLDVLTCEERHEGRGLGVIWYENPFNER